MRALDYGDCVPTTEKGREKSENRTHSGNGLFRSAQIASNEPQQV